MSAPQSQPVFNTSRHGPNGEAKALGMLCEAMGGHGDGMIERQEAQGQASFVNSTQLPIEGSRDPVFAAMGIVLGKATDDLFVEATLPDGWKKQATSHSMWSDLVDDKGRARAHIFYKAAFYDRSAHITPCRFVNLETDYDRTDAAVTRVVAGGEIVFSSEEIPITDPAHRYESMDVADAQATQWADEHYPDRDNAAVYWNDK